MLQVLGFEALENTSISRQDSLAGKGTCASLKTGVQTLEPTYRGTIRTSFTNCPLISTQAPRHMHLHAHIKIYKENTYLTSRSLLLYNITENMNSGQTLQAVFPQTIASAEKGAKGVTVSTELHTTTSSHQMQDAPCNSNYSD